VIGSRSHAPLLAAALAFLRALATPRATLVLENTALREQILDVPKAQTEAESQTAWLMISGGKRWR
jgi:hypothetical protein